MMTLLQAEGAVTPSCSKSHITYTLHLHRDCRELHVEFAYEPKRLDDEAKSEALIRDALKRFVPAEQDRSPADNWKDYMPLQNLLTLSIDDETGFRGAGHRHDPVQHLTVTPEQASPGLVPGIFPRGQLRIMISIHCVVTEQCRYRMHVWEGRDIQ
ncbi:hypothetical protein [Paenibacillus piri]|uniref:Uncharacterized protein n=1 Tax=Paenibacillus piri TaxID=2547395 RepID=A0A4R5KDN9_9BACL|nr:hypothetical protein [Paenibacillus piri]TDF92307.1 hypothetical protein E1757_30010 [Paenibacillus piri]